MARWRKNGWLVSCFIALATGWLLVSWWARASSAHSSAADLEKIESRPQNSFQIDDDAPHALGGNSSQSDRPFRIVAIGDSITAGSFKVTLLMHVFLVHLEFALTFFVWASFFISPLTLK